MDRENNLAVNLQRALGFNQIFRWHSANSVFMSAGQDCCRAIVSEEQNEAVLTGL